MYYSFPAFAHLVVRPAEKRDPAPDGDASDRDPYRVVTERPTALPEGVTRVPRRPPAESPSRA
jgi:hypothetical protein